MTRLTETIASLAWTQLWQVTTVIVAVGSIARFFCRRRPHLAHVLWLVVLVKCVTPPLWSSPTGVFSWAMPRFAAAVDDTPIAMNGSPSSPKSPTTEPSPPDNTIEDNLPSAAQLDESRPAVARASSKISVVAETATLVSGRPAAELRIGPTLVRIWLAGSAVSLVCAWLAVVNCWKVIAKNRRPVDERLAVLLGDLRRRLGIRRRVRLFVVCEPLGPMSFGVVRPAVVLPQMLAERSSEELVPLLGHELVHVRRGDSLVGLMQVLVQCLWWFHPLVWWANRQIVRERERCCDEEVIGGLACEPSRYARCLIDVLELKSQMQWLPALPGIRSFEVTRQRLEDLMQRPNQFLPRMPRSYWLVLAAGLLLLAPGAGRTAASSAATSEAGIPSKPPVVTPSPTRDAHSAAEAKSKSAAAPLVEAVYANEAWIDSAKSVRIRTRSEQVSPEESRRLYRKQPRHSPFPFNEKTALQPVTTLSEWAWDTARFRWVDEYTFPENPADKRVISRIWNGAIALQHWNDHAKDKYEFGSRPGQFFERRARRIWHPWGAGGVGQGHSFWWFPTNVAESRRGSFVSPDDFELVGREDVNGRRCNVVESRPGCQRLHIGEADGRPYRVSWFAFDPSLPGFDINAICRKVSGGAMKTANDWDSWFKALAPNEQRAARRRLETARFEFTRPWACVTLDDYREVVPGHWLPFHQAQESYNIEGPQRFLDSHIDMTITELTINQPLSDDLFRVELKEGVPVGADWRYDPPIRYTYRTNQSEAERIALRDAERKQRDEGTREMERRRALLNSRVGSAPIALPRSGWLNGGPLTWEELRGKVVVLHFWSVACGACQNDFPRLAQWHADAANNGIVVIGIHPPTGDLAAVRAKLEKYGITYPVLIDGPPSDPKRFGLLHDWFGDTWWPNTVLLGKQGLIAGHGELLMGDIPAQVRRLAAETDRNASPAVAAASDVAAPSAVKEEKPAREQPYPQVIESKPSKGATGVDPDLKEIRVTFDRDMGRGMSWTGGPPFFPPGDKKRKARWVDGRTCVLPVHLEKGRYYRLGINSSNHHNFRSRDRISAPPSVLYFTTEGATKEVEGRLHVPTIITLQPANGAKDVDPATRELRVTFDVPMGKGMSWTGSGPKFPQSATDEKAKWSSDGRTCTLPVQLEPGHDYELGLNSLSFISFGSEWGVPLEPILYRFHTGETGADGEEADSTRAAPPGGERRREELAVFRLRALFLVS